MRSDAPSARHDSVLLVLGVLYAAVDIGSLLGVGPGARGLSALLMLAGIAMAIGVVVIQIAGRPFSGAAVATFLLLLAILLSLSCSVVRG